MSDELILEYSYTTVHGDRRRVVIEPAREGTWRYEYVRDGVAGGWRLQGREPVEAVAVDRSAAD